MSPLPIEALSYLNTQHIGVLAVEMLDGSPHGATVHFAYTDEPLQILIQTGAKSLKCEALLKNGETRASFVIGIDESEMKTFQLDGIARVAKKDEEESFINTFIAKFPSKEERAKEPGTVSIIFTPTWWRFTDMKTPEGRKVWVSNPVV